MYHYTDSELIGGIMEQIRGERERPFPWFLWRDMVLDAEGRGLVSITRGEKPFWWEYSQVALTESGKAVYEAVVKRK